MRFSFYRNFREIFFYPRKVSIHQWFYCKLAMFQSFLKCHISEFVFPPCTLLGFASMPEYASELFWVDFRQCLLGFVKPSPCMCPTPSDFQVLTFLFDGVINLISIRHTDSIEVFRIFADDLRFWMADIRIRRCAHLHSSGTTVR